MLTMLAPWGSTNVGEYKFLERAQHDAALAAQAVQQRGGGGSGVLVHYEQTVRRRQ